jgi:hypothetical protein
MSFIQKEVIEKTLSWQTKKDVEDGELKRMTNQFAENERTKQAKDIAFGEKLQGLRNQFSEFFSARPREGQS